MEKTKSNPLIIVSLLLIVVVVIIGVFFVYIQGKDRAYKLEDTQREEYLKSKSSSEEAVKKANSDWSEYLDKQLEESKKKSAYDECIKGVYDAYLIDWNKECKGQKKADDCNLPEYNADSINKERVRKEEVCMQLYKAN